MNKFVKDMLMSKYGGGQDGRNPYGSRGGYVTSYDPRHDRAMYDQARGYQGGNRYDRAEYDMRRDYNMPYQHDFARNDMGYQHPYQYNDNRGYDMRGNDYGEMQFGKMTEQDIEKWEHSLINSDGTKGPHFRKDQIEQAARQTGINPSQFGNEKVFGLIMNAMYADYCGVAKKYGVDRPDYYADMSKAFLDDKDYKGKGEEKAWLYYKCIASEE